MASYKSRLKVFSRQDLDERWEDLMEHHNEWEEMWRQGLDYGNMSPAVMHSPRLPTIRMSNEGGIGTVTPAVKRLYVSGILMP